MKILNLYAGLGGNRKLWGNEHDITSVEYAQGIADIYAAQYPNDTLVVGDAHSYLLENFQNFDFIWSSPPCQSHSRLIRSGKNRKSRYPDLRLYEEILLLQHNFKGKWLVENVIPYYTPLVAPTATIGRHMMGSSAPASALDGIEDIKSPPDFINMTNVAGMRKLQKWLGIHYEKPIYYEGNHCPAQVLRNCVHPNLGQRVLNKIVEDFLTR